MTMDSRFAPGPFPPLQVQGLRFHPVIRLSDDYEVYDFTTGYDPARPRASAYGN